MGLLSKHRTRFPLTVRSPNTVLVPCSEEQCGYHIDPNNPSDIAWGVISALESPEKRKWLGKNGRKRVLAEFTWSKIAEKTIALYEKMLKR